MPSNWTFEMLSIMQSLLKLLHLCVFASPYRMNSLSYYLPFRHSSFLSSLFP